MIELLYYDKDKAVAIKPVGVSSEGEGMPLLVQRALEEKGVNCTVYPLHRLDIAVGGVMIFALNKATAGKMSEAIVSGEGIKKEYFAVVHGIPQERNGIMQDLLFKDSRANKSYIVKRERKGVKKASLEYEVLETCGDLSLVRVLLHTGRTHQIRGQFAGRKMPLYADGKYGGRDNGKIALYSCRITLPDGVFFESFPPRSHPWELFDFFENA